MIAKTGSGPKQSEIQAPIACVHLAIYFSCLYIWSGWFFDTDSGFGPVVLVLTSVQAFGFNRAITE